MPNSQPVRIAVIDDDEDDYFIIKDYINAIEGPGFVVDWCRDYASAVERIKSKAYQLYFVDYRLGNKTGLELLQEAAQLTCDEPIVLLTGKGNKSIDVKAMQSGATDYLIKSELNTEKLERCIRYSLDRAAAMKELKTRESKYRNIFEGSNDAIFIADPFLVLIEMNNATSALLGIPASELKGRGFYDFIKEESQRATLRNLLAHKSNVSELEILVEGQDNESHSCVISLTFLENADGDALLHGIVHDITSLKKAEQANLHAEKLAANERLVRMLAHEIRNPLNNISLSIDNLQLPGNEAGRQLNLLNIIQRNCSRINLIITELLDLAKPIELNFRPYPLSEIVDESLLEATDRINLQRIQVHKKYPTEQLLVLADKSRLVIAFTNILINAIEAMEIEKGQLNICIEKAGDMTALSIEDNGSGISEEHLAKLFEPFFTMKKNGMGLGLATSYSIIQSHRGKIAVESGLGKGTTFTISFQQAERS